MYSFTVEVGAVRIETVGLKPTRRLLLDLMGEAAGVTLALLSDDTAGSSAEADNDDEGDQPPFGFAPLTADVQAAPEYHDPRFDWVWDEDEDDE